MLAGRRSDLAVRMLTTWVHLASYQLYSSTPMQGSELTPGCAEVLSWAQAHNAPQGRQERGRGPPQARELLALCRLRWCSQQLVCQKGQPAGVGLARRSSQCEYSSPERSDGLARLGAGPLPSHLAHLRTGQAVRVSAEAAGG